MSRFSSSPSPSYRRSYVPSYGSALAEYGAASQESVPEQNVFEIGARPSYASRSGASLSGSVLATRPRTTSQGTFGQVQPKGIGGNVGTQQASFGDLGTQAHQQTLDQYNQQVALENSRLDPSEMDTSLLRSIQTYNDAMNQDRGNRWSFIHSPMTGFRAETPMNNVAAAGQQLAESLRGYDYSSASPEFGSFARWVNAAGNPAQWNTATGVGYLDELNASGVVPDNRKFRLDAQNPSNRPFGMHYQWPVGDSWVSGHLGSIYPYASALRGVTRPAYSPWTNSAFIYNWGNANAFLAPDAPFPQGGYGNRFTTNPGTFFHPAESQYSIDISRDVPSVTTEGQYQYSPGVQRTLQPGQRESFGSRQSGQYVQGPGRTAYGDVSFLQAPQQLNFFGLY